MADEPQLQKGESGEWVQYLQQLLQSSGSWTGDADGTFGDELEQVVMQVQSSNGLSADGVVNASTWAVLTGETGAASASTADQSTADAGSAGEGQQTGDVPAEFVAAGAPPSLDQWTAEQKQGYFVGKEPIEDVGGETPDNVEVLAMSETGEGDEGAIA